MHESGNLTSDLRPGQKLKVMRVCGGQTRVLIAYTHISQSHPFINSSMCVYDCQRVGGRVAR